MCKSLNTCCFRGWEHSTCWERCPHHRHVSEGHDLHWAGDAPGGAAGGPASHRAGSHAGETGVCCGQAEDWDTAPTCQGYDWLQWSGGTCGWQPSSALQLPQRGRVDQGGITPIKCTHQIHRDGWGVVLGTSCSWSARELVAGKGSGDVFVLEVLCFWGLLMCGRSYLCSFESKYLFTSQLENWTFFTSGVRAVWNVILVLVLFFMCWLHGWFYKIFHYYTFIVETYNVWLLILALE